MEILEFETKITNGMIKLPKYFNTINGQQVKVVIKQVKKNKKNEILEKLKIIFQESKKRSVTLKDRNIDEIAKEALNGLS